MKLYAFYLPQFHQIPENDLWWGEGFTEWTKVKSAEPLFRGHEQPQLPLKQNYYNLLEKSTVEWQTDIMKQYGVDAMAYYHYYFKGKKLLERPAENLLKWKDVQQPFFFCWANHDWRRTWEGKQTLLMEQQYGNRNDWEEHFQYLLPFFKDDRYEKIDNCPVFMLFFPFFDEKKDMMQYFDTRCKQEGFAGLYLIECSKGQPDEIAKLRASNKIKNHRILLREPEYAKIKYYAHIERNKWVNYYHVLMKKVARLCGSAEEPVRFKGDNFFKRKIACYSHEDDLLQCVCLSWDNTVRHGKRGYVISPVSKRLFFKYMDTIKQEPCCFINAWNEWAEGMVLEPTEQKGYQYLEWIREWKQKNEK